MRSHLVKIVASVFYIGRIPFASGTFGALAGLIFYYYFHRSILLDACIIVVGFFIGEWVSTRAEIIYKEKDSHKIVIDECVGMWIAVFCLPFSYFYFIAGFLLFRLFDVIKPLGIRKIQKLPGGWGVMLDDLLSAALANIILQIVHLAFPF